jgi:hypothetical protein
MADPMPPVYVSGLDLGQAGQFTALACVEKQHLPDADRPGRLVYHYAARHLERFKLGASFPGVIDQLRERFAKPPLEGTVIVVDRTAVGEAVYRMFLAARLPATLIPVTMTAAGTADRDDRGLWRLPKLDLVGTVQMLLQEKRLKVAPVLEHAQTLVGELRDFSLKKVPLDPTAVEWRERPHDDLVFALSLACHHGERSAFAGGWVVMDGPDDLDDEDDGFNPYTNHTHFMGVRVHRGAVRLDGAGGRPDDAYVAGM